MKSTRNPHEIHTKSHIKSDKPRLNPQQISHIIATLDRWNLIRPTLNPDDIPRIAGGRLFLPDGSWPSTRPSAASRPGTLGGQQFHGLVGFYGDLYSGILLDFVGFNGI